MHAKIYSATTVGIGAQLVEVEVDLALGLVNFCIVGLPDKAIKESKDRIKAALKNSGLRMPQRLITVNLAPANVKKEGVLFDLPIAIGMLAAAELISLSKEFIEETIFLGELSLDGSIRPVRGMLPIAHFACAQGKKRVIIPQANVLEACLIKGLEIIGVSSLQELVGYLREEIVLTPARFIDIAPTTHASKKSGDFNQVKGQWQAKRALEIAAAGRHNILFIGPPGSGKTMLAERLSTILPPMNFEEIIETTKVYSIAGLLADKGLMLTRPFRAPHHTISPAGLVGGGSTPQPGEISLAHNGILFLDELTEFKRSTLEVLRQPLEQKKVLISRAQQALEFPANFLLVAALNPCPCGFFGDKKRSCLCSTDHINRYLGKLSGPLLDRIDLHVTVSAVNFEEIEQVYADEQSSAILYQKVLAALELKKARHEALTAKALGKEQIEEYCPLTPEATAVLKKAFEVLALSMRSYHKILKISRTIADLEGSEMITALHIREALLYRSLDQKLQKISLS